MCAISLGFVFFFLFLRHPNACKDQCMDISMHFAIDCAKILAYNYLFNLSLCMKENGERKIKPSKKKMKEKTKQTTTETRNRIEGKIATQPKHVKKVQWMIEPVKCIDRCWVPFCCGGYLHYNFFIMYLYLLRFRMIASLKWVTHCMGFFSFSLSIYAFIFYVLLKHELWMWKKISVIKHFEGRLTVECVAKFKIEWCILIKRFHLILATHLTIDAPNGTFPFAEESTECCSICWLNTAIYLYAINISYNILFAANTSNTLVFLSLLLLLLLSTLGS